jgi:DNA polymerase sigma
MDLILTSRIPVLKFKYVTRVLTIFRSRLGGVKIDITVNNNDGPASTALVLEWVGKYPELRPIAYVPIYSQRID